jgi:peptidyl-tRNA hydrolase, PTH1 family
MDTPIRLIVGLGNPGPDYQHSRHNSGADLLMRLARTHKVDLSTNTRLFGLCGNCVINQHLIHLLMPTTFMNMSGRAVGAVANFYKIQPEAILVVHDELDLPPGIARFKFGGGHGGHNGLRDTICALANNHNFARLRIGIGHPGNAKQVTGYVLKKAPENERQLINDSIDRACKMIPMVCSGQWERAMQQLHTTL